MHEIQYRWDRSEDIESGSERNAPGKSHGALAQLFVDIVNVHVWHLHLEISPPNEFHAALRMRPDRYGHPPAVDYSLHNNSNVYIVTVTARNA